MYKIILSLITSLCLITANSHAATKVSLNQNFIEGVYSTVNIENPDEVFKLIFDNLPDEVTVYPTENYFYFSFNANGKTIWGNLRLDASDRDQGVLHLGYFEYDENGKFQDIDGYEKDFNQKDGVIVKKLKKLTYSVSFKGREVTFQLNDIGMQRPQKAKLLPNETYVGPVFDESGVKFFLIFNKAKKHFMYVLNEEEKAIETYRKLTKDVYIGRRTGFAYYNDAKNNRKILVAINGFNVKRNNYYDGPFDQLPDNYVDETNLQQYMEEAYPEVKGKINKFGHFLEHQGNRVMIAAYMVYFEDKDLSFVKSCRETYKDNAEFYTCITPDRM